MRNGMSMTKVRQFLALGDVPVVVTMLRDFPYTNGVAVAIVRPARKPIALVHEEFEFEDRIFVAEYEVEDEEPSVPSHGRPVPPRLAYESAGERGLRDKREPNGRAHRSRRNFGCKPRRPWDADRRFRHREQFDLTS